jgi:hypothetical protein
MYGDSRCQFLLVLMLLGVAFLLLPKMVVACAIAPKPTVLQAYEESDVVIIARAISVERLNEQSEKPRTKFDPKHAPAARVLLSSAAANQLTRFLASRNSPPLYTIAHSR